jgi:hypothetical protein
MLTSADVDQIELCPGAAGQLARDVQDSLCPRRAIQRHKDRPIHGSCSFLLALIALCAAKYALAPLEDHFRLNALLRGLVML